MAYHHLITVEHTFLGKESALLKNIVGHINADIAMNRNADIVLSPCIVIEYQKPVSTILIGYNMLFGESFFIGNWARFGNLLESDFNFNSLAFTAGYILFSQNKKEPNILKFLLLL